MRVIFCLPFSLIQAPNEDGEEGSESLSLSLRHALGWTREERGRLAIATVPQGPCQFSAGKLTSGFNISPRTMCSILWTCSWFKVQVERVWRNGFYSRVYFWLYQSPEGADPPEGDNSQKKKKIWEGVRKGRWMREREREKEMCQLKKETYDSPFNVHLLSHDKASICQLTRSLIKYTVHSSTSLIPAVVIRGRWGRCPPPRFPTGVQILPVPSVIFFFTSLSICDTFTPHRFLINVLLV